METNPRRISVLVAQFPISLDVRHNLEAILSIMARAETDDLIVLPEGALSGYEEDPSFLYDIDTALLTESLDKLRAEVVQQRLHLIFGACLQENRNWYNTGIYYGPQGETFVYRKINLTTNEHEHFIAGSQLPILEVLFQCGAVRLGIQICREIRFPEQWQYLARAGAEILVHINNAVGDETLAPVWRSHLISRAAENQRFVLSANNAQPEQKCPSLIIGPSGHVIWETLSAKLDVMRCTLDLGEVSDWYLNQSRGDIFSVRRRTI
jgi:predicted amidohydrolase